MTAILWHRLFPTLQMRKLRPKKHLSFLWSVIQYLDGIQTRSLWLQVLYWWLLNSLKFFKFDFIQFSTPCLLKSFLLLKDYLLPSSPLPNSSSKVPDFPTPSFNCPQQMFWRSFLLTTNHTLFHNYSLRYFTCMFYFLPPRNWTHSFTRENNRFNEHLHA